MKSILQIGFLDLIGKISGKISGKNVFRNKKYDEVFSKFNVKKDKFSKKEEILVFPFNLSLTKENPLEGVEIAGVEIVSSKGNRIEQGARISFG